MLINSSYLLISLMLAWSPARTPGAQDIPVEMDRISDRAVVLRCLSNNVTVIAARDGLVVVDTHRSPGVMEEIKRRAAHELGRDDFRYVINTHGHWDHCSGNQVFDGAAIFGHSRCREYILHSPANSRRMVHRLRRRVQTVRPNRTADDLAEIQVNAVILSDLESSYAATPPTQTFEDRQTIDAGDLTLELYYCGWAHTDHDIIVFIPEERLVFTGDLFCSRNSFCFSVDAVADTPKLLSVLDDILELEPDHVTVIPGHGEPFDRDALVDLRARLANKLSEVAPERSAARAIADLARDEGSNAALAAARRAQTAGMRGLYVDEEEFFTLARRYLGRGETDLSIAVVEFALGSHPESALLYDILAEAHLKSGDTGAAVRYYEKSLALEPLNRNAEQMLELLRD